MTQEEQQNGKPKPLPTGSPDVDPTKNVLQLVEASIKRIDDIMAALFKRVDDLINVQIRRIDDKIDTESKHVREIEALREQHTKDLREAEAKRIDAIRVVDVNAVSVASGKASDSALVLAKQVSDSAEALRKLVADTAMSTATQLSQIIKPITDNIALLQKAQYEGAGKSGVTDPLMKELFDKMDKVISAQSLGTGKSAGLNMGWAYLLGSLTFISTVMGIVVIIINYAK